MATDLNTLPDGFEVETIPEENNFQTQNDIQTHAELPDGFQIEHTPESSSFTFPGDKGWTISAYEPPSLLDKAAEALNWVLKTPFAAIEEGKAQVEQSELEMKEMAFRRLNDKDKNRLQSLTNRQPDDFGIDNISYDRNPSNFPARSARFLKRSYAWGFQQVPILLSTLKDTAIGAGIGAIAGAGGAVVLGQLGVQVAAPEEVVTVPAAAIAGAVWGGRIGAGKRVFELEAGLARSELKQVNEDIVQKGGKPMPQGISDLLSVGVGGVNAVMEMISLKAILRTVPGGKELLQKIEKKEVMNLAQNEVLRARLEQIPADYIHALMTEAATEAAQEATNIVADEILRKYGGVENTPLEQCVSRAIQAGVQGFGATLFLGGVGSSAQAVKIMTLQGMSEKAAKAKVENMTTEEKQTYVDENFGQLVKSIGDLPSVKELEEMQQHDEARQQVAQEVYKTLKDSGQEEDLSRKLADVASVFYERIAQGDESGKTAKEIYDNYNVTVRGGVSVDVDNSGNVIKNNTEVAQNIEQKETYNQPVRPNQYFSNDKFEIDAQQKDNYSLYTKRIERFLENPKNYSGTVSLGKTPQSLTESGLDEIPLETDTKIIKKMMRKDKDHVVKSRTVKALPYLLHNPLAVFESNTQPESVIVLLNAQDKNGLPVMVSIKKNVQKNVNEVNFITSGYGRKKEFFRRLMSEEKLLKITKNAPDWLQEFKNSENNSISENHKSVNTASNGGNIIIADDKGQNNPETYYQRTKKTNTLNFKKWFGKSVTVDENGRPQVFYHGSGKVFSVFDRNKSGKSNSNASHVGFWFTPVKKLAKDFQKFNKSYFDRGKVYKVFLKMENPKVYEFIDQTKNIQKLEKKLSVLQEKQNKLAKRVNKDLDHTDLRYIFNYVNSDTEENKAHYTYVLENYGLRTSISRTYFLKAKETKTLFKIEDNFKSNLQQIKELKDKKNILENNDPYDLFKNDLDKFTKWYNGAIDFKEGEHLKNYGAENGRDAAQKLVDKLKSEGYDGIIIKNTNFDSEAAGGINSQYIVFDPEQIKAVNNHGRFDSQNPDIYYQFLGKRALTADINSLENAKAAVENGTDPEAVRQETGWFKGVDGKWKFEISDKDAVIDEWAWSDVTDRNGEENKFLGHLLKHPKLFRAYPELRNLMVKIHIDENGTPGGTFYKKSDPTFYFDGSQSYIEVEASNIDEFKEILMHEIQHYIQHKEGFAVGGNIDNISYDIYKKLAGETEARNTKVRSKLSDDEIIAISPDSTSDIKQSEQIVIFDDGSSAFSQNLENELHQSEKIEVEQGKISFFKDENGNVRKTIIDIMEGTSDRTTALHEFSHLFLKTLIMESKSNLKAREMLLSVNKWLGTDGSYYTKDHHEKFAEGFEAYIASGKAPTYKLKQAFEKFSKWIKDLYQQIKYNTEIKVSPEAEEVFNQLFGGDHYEEYKAQAKILLENASAYAQLRYKPTPEQLKYKEVAYDILATALRKNPKWLKTVLESNSNAWGIQRKREKIQLALENVEDEIEQMDSWDWIKYFGHVQLGEELNASNNLARRAYDVIANKEYLNRYEEDADLQESELEYKFLLNEYKKNKKEANRTIAQLAFYEWIESVSELIRDDLAEKWVNDTNEIERFENLNKFDRAKEILRQNAVLLKSEDGKEEYKNIVQTVLKSLSFLSPTDRVKMLNQITAITTTEKLKEDIDEIMDFAQTLEDMSIRRNISEAIQEEVKGTKNIRKNGKTYGKYDYHTNKMFEKLREINAMDSEAIQYEYSQMCEDFEAMSDAEKENLTFEQKLIRKFTQYKAYGKIYNQTDFLNDLYSDLVFAKLQGKLSKDESDFQKRLENKYAIEEVYHNIEDKKEANPILKQYAKMCNIESFLNWFCNNEIKDKYSLLWEQVQKDTASYHQKQNVLKGLSNILKTNDVDGKIFEKLAEKYEFQNYSYLTPQTDTLTKMDLITAYIYQKNALLKERLLLMYGKGGLERMFSLMSAQDFEIGDLLQRTAESYYPKINKIFIKKYGVDMPKSKKYFPVTAIRDAEVDMFNQFTEMLTTPKFMKERSNLVKIPIKLGNPVSILFNHIEKSNNLIFCEDKVTKLNKIFRSRDVARAITNKFGEESYEIFLNRLAESSFSGQNKSLDAAMNFLNSAVNGFIVSTIAFKPKIGITQLVSAVNFWEHMPAKDWGKGFLEALSHPKKTIKFMMEDEYLQQRFGSGAINEAMARVAEASALTKSKKYIDYFTLNVRLGDVGAIIFGGKPYVEYLMKQGFTKEEAFKKFILEVNRAQQSSVTSSLGAFQMDKNPIYRLYNAFQNTSNQYFRKTIDGIISYNNGDIDAQQLVKTTFIYTFLNSVLYKTVSNPYIWLAGLTSGEWDDLGKELISSIFELNSSCVIWLGQIYQVILNGILGKNNYSNIKGLDKITADTAQFFKKVKKSDLDFETAIQLLADLGDMSGIPVSTLINTGTAANDFIKGEPGVGIMKLYGLSDYAAKKSFGKKDK